MNLRNGWNIEFQKNIHMYCHRLIATKGDKHGFYPVSTDGWVKSLKA